MIYVLKKGLTEALGRIKRHKRSRQLSQFLNTLSIGSFIDEEKRARKTIIVASSHFGMTNISKVEIFLSSLLAQNQGANIILAICDGSLEACAMCESKTILGVNIDINTIKKIECSACIGLMTKDLEKYLENNNIRVVKYGSIEQKIHKNIINEAKKILNTTVIDEKYDYILEQSLSGIVRYLGKPISKEEAFYTHREVYKQYIMASLRASYSWSHIIEKYKPSRIIINHGMYVPQGIINKEAQKKNIETRVWHLGYRKNTLLITNNESYHKTLVSKKDYRRGYLDERKRKIIKEYLYSRRNGDNDQISFVHKNAENESIVKFINKSEGNNITLILTNVAWDAQCHYENNVYGSMYEWIDDLVEQVIKTQINEFFVVRCHPAEVTGRRVATLKTSDYILNKYGAIPNMQVISSDEKVSTYKLIEISTKVIVYATKTAVEAACMGKPVLVCGESFVKGKDISIDQTNKSDLLSDFNKLDKYKVNHEKALSAAYDLFFDKMVKYEIDSKQNSLDSSNMSNSANSEIISRLID